MVSLKQNFPRNQASGTARSRCSWWPRGPGTISSAVPWLFQPWGCSLCPRHPVQMKRGCCCPHLPCMATGIRCPWTSSAQVLPLDYDQGTGCTDYLRPSGARTGAAGGVCFSRNQDPRGKGGWVPTTNVRHGQAVLRRSLS